MLIKERDVAKGFSLGRGCLTKTIPFTGYPANLSTLAYQHQAEKIVILREGRSPVHFLKGAK